MIKKNKGFVGACRQWLQMCCLVLVFFLFSPLLSAAPDAELWDYWARHNPSNYRDVDHSDWNSLLQRYVVSNHPSGINRFRYGDVSKKDKRLLDNYIDSLAAMDPRLLSKRVQKAYWMNLYNALTVQLVLEKYPVASITKMHSRNPLSFGPWGKKVVKINGKRLTLNDIEHRILRPVWNDHRIHFGLSCASLGCPSLLPEAFTAANSKRLLKQAGRDFMKHPRALRFENKVLHLSSLFKWYQKDFAKDEKVLKKFLSHYAEDKNALYLLGYSGKIVYHHDWGLNEP